MPITQPESTLSVDDYNLLKTLKTHSVYSIVAHRYNLAFSRFQTGTDEDNHSPDFDAVICNGFIFRVSGVDTMTRYEITTDIWTSVSAFDAPLSAIVHESPTLVVDGTTLYAFVGTSSGISVSHSTDDGATWTSWSQIVAVTNVFKISAVSPTRVHYIVKDTTKLIFNLRCVNYSGSWSATASDIWLQFEPSNIAAVQYGTKDVVALAVQVPGVNTLKTVNGTVIKYIQPSGGIICFNYQYETWSDHVEVDVVDALTAFRYRDRVKLSVINNRLFLTAYAADGTQLFPFTFYRMYTSEDGLWWSKGETIPLGDGEGKQSGIKLLFSGDYVYGVERAQSHKSLSTLMTGYSPASVQVNITDTGTVQEHNITQGDMFQAVTVISNADGWLTNHSIIKKQNRILLVHNIGYRDPDTFVPIIVQVAMTEVDTIDFSTELPRKMVRITSRDRLAWMTDRTAAERPYIWDSQLLGADDYTDYTATGYDGLRHSAQQSGAWSASDNKLILESSNVEGVTFSTYTPYLWNGETQTGIALATAGNSEYAGVVFRAVDKDNLLAAIYNQSNDKIELRDRTGGVDVVLQRSSSTMGWSGTPTTQRWIRVEFRYARNIVFTSTNGATWTEQINYLQSSSKPTDTDNRKMRGYVGFIGKGFAPAENTWSPDPGPSEPPITDPYDPIYTDPYSDSTYDPGTIFIPTPGSPPVITISTPSDGNTQIFWDDTHLKMVTTGIILLEPIERDITPPLEEDELIISAKVDRYSPGIYCLTSNEETSRVWFAPDMGTYPDLDWVDGELFDGFLDTLKLGSEIGKVTVKGVPNEDIGVETTFDFETGQHGWSVSVNSGFSPTNQSNYTSSVGFTSQASDGVAFPTNRFSQTVIQITLPTANIFNIDIYYADLDAGNDADPFGDNPQMIIELDGSTLQITNNLTPGSGVISWSGEELGSVLKVGLDIGFRSDSVACTGTGTITKIVISNVVDVVALFSEDYGVTLSPPKSIIDFTSGFDVQKAGDIVLAGSNLKILKGSNEDNFEDYGDPQNQGEIYIPRTLYNLSALNDGDQPQYVLSALEVNDDGQSLWRVSSDGDTFTDITPIISTNPGLSSGPHSLEGHWMTSKHILGLLSFDDVIKLAVTINGGLTWVYSDDLDDGVTFITTRRGDFDSIQAWWINGNKIAYCANYQLPVITFVERTYSLAEIKGFDVFG